MITKPTLALPPDSCSIASWNRSLHRMLASSGMFNVDRDHDLPLIPKSKYGRVAKNLSTFRLDGNLIALDTWDTNSPSDRCHEQDEFKHGALSEVKLLLKIQWQPDDCWKQFTDETGVPVTPWTVFPTQEFPLECFDYNPRASHLFIATLTGVNRYGRGEYMDLARREEDFYAKQQNEKDDLDEYINVLRTCKWGVSLRGKRGTDGKNRREIEFSSCGMPLALNYTPHYPFPFEPGKHYYYLRSSEDLLNLRCMDPAPFAQMSRQIYKQYFSCKGMASNLCRLANQLINAQLPVDAL